MEVIVDTALDAAEGGGGGGGWGWGVSKTKTFNEKLQIDR